MSNETIRVPITTELDAFFSQYTAADQAKGLVYGMTTADGLFHSEGFGVANDDGLAPDADTLFPIASMSKSFVACAALLARDRGLLSINDPITKYVPEFSAGGVLEDQPETPTLQMLFSMSGGLTEDNSWVDPFIDLPKQQLLDRVRVGLRYSHVPGAAYEYSNLGYALAGLALGRAVGRSIEEFVAEEILLPLGLTSTFFDSAVPAGVPRALGYHLDPDGTWAPYPSNASDAFAPAGGLVSTVRDLATWVTWLGSAFRAPGHDVDLISRASRRELQRMHIISPPSLTIKPDGSTHTDIGGYGLGLRITLDLHRGTVVSHAGGLPGFKLFMCWHPDSGNGMVVLTNSHRGDPVELCSAALGRVLARDRTPAETIVLWPETVTLRSATERLIRRWDESLASQIFAENVDFDRPLAERREEVEQLVAEIGPLLEPRPLSDIVSAATAADVTWSIPGQNGELLCMIHLTPTEPAQIQEFVVHAVPTGQSRATAPVDISARRAHLGDVFIGPSRNVRVELPEQVADPPADTRGAP